MCVFIYFHYIHPIRIVIIFQSLGVMMFVVRVMYLVIGGEAGVTDLNDNCWISR